ncbi:MAG: helix-turn-helix domain-containing protein [Pirellulales bacterium]|nr:helix-turn-helix domain-containing protein [Pirellulales bacterium]
MLAPDVVRTIKQLLAEGNLSQREIARQMGVSRGSVNAIALGKRPDYEARRRKKVQDCAERCRNCGVMYLMLYVSGRMRDLIEEVWIESLLREADASLQSQYGGETPQPTDETHAECPTGATCACRSRCASMPNGNGAVGHNGDRGVAGKSH